MTQGHTVPDSEVNRGFGVTQKLEMQVRELTELLNKERGESHARRRDLEERNKAELQAAQKKISELEKNSGNTHELERKLHDSEGNCQQLMNNLEEKRRIITDLKAEHASHTDAGTVKTIRDELRDIQQKLAVANSSLQEKALKLKEANAIIVGLKADQKHVHNEQMTSLARQLVKSKENHSEALALYQTTKNAHDVLHAKLSTMSSNELELHAQSETLKGVIKTLQSENETLKHLLSQCEAHLIKLRQQVQEHYIRKQHNRRLNPKTEYGDFGVVNYQMKDAEIESLFKLHDSVHKHLHGNYHERQIYGWETEYEKQMATVSRAHENHAESQKQSGKPVAAKSEHPGMASQKKMEESRLGKTINGISATLRGERNLFQTMTAPFNGAFAAAQAIQNRRRQQNNDDQSGKV
jgi:hypothetical protein